MSSLHRKDIYTKHNEIILKTFGSKQKVGTNYRNTVREDVKYLITDPHPRTMLSPCKKNASYDFNIVWGEGVGMLNAL